MPFDHLRYKPESIFGRRDSYSITESVPNIRAVESLMSSILLTPGSRIGFLITDQLSLESIYDLFETYQ